MPEPKESGKSGEQCALDGFNCALDAVKIDDKAKRVAKARKCIADYFKCIKESKKKESQRQVQLNRLETALAKKLKTLK